jgi:hypothetical protein
VKPVVFLGPSLELATARQVLEADYRPPVAMGDVHAAVREGARTIVIIDGLFEQVPAVWHKEILFALEQGVSVYGSSSMGALRAAELAGFGMTGSGWVFEQYRSGAIEDDDEVAVAHADAGDGYRPLSDALVNIRHGLDRARAEAGLSPECAEGMLRLARDCFYAERSWKGLFAGARSAGLPEEQVSRLSAYVALEHPNVKRDDALALLRRLADPTPLPAQGPRPWTLERTVFWHRLVDTTSRLDQREQPGDGLLRDQVRDWVRVAATEYEEIRRAALLMELLEAEAATGGRPPNAVLKEAAERFRRHRGLLSASDLERWLAANRMSQRDFWELIEKEARLESRLAAMGQRWERHLLHELRRRGALPAVLAQLAGRGQHPNGATGDGQGNPVPLEEMYRWYASRGRTTEPSLQQEAQRLGFSSTRNFVDELTAQYLYSHEAKRRSA